MRRITEENIECVQPLDQAAQGEGDSEEKEIALEAARPDRARSVGHADRKRLRRPRVAGPGRRGSIPP
jgi:hypothetical protein